MLAGVRWDLEGVNDCFRELIGPSHEVAMEPAMPLGTVFTEHLLGALYVPIRHIRFVRGLRAVRSLMLSRVHVWSWKGMAVRRGDVGVL